MARDGDGGVSDTYGTHILAAASWLADQHEPPAHVVPALKGRFGITGLQGCQAIALARGAPLAKLSCENVSQPIGEDKA